MPPFETKITRPSTSTPGPLHINIAFDEEESRMLRDAAAEMNVSPSAVVRHALHEFFFKD